MYTVYFMEVVYLFLINACFRIEKKKLVMSLLHQTDNIEITKLYVSNAKYNNSFFKYLLESSIPKELKLYLIFTKID